MMGSLNVQVPGLLGSLWIRRSEAPETAFLIYFPGILMSPKAFKSHSSKVSSNVPLELSPLSHGASGLSRRAGARCINKGQLEAVQGKARESTKGEEDDLLGKPEGAEGQGLCEGTQKPHINPGAQLAARAERYHIPWGAGIRRLMGAGITHRELKLCARETFVIPGLNC